MVSYQCQICRKYFTTHGGLIQHASAKHHGHHRRIALQTNNPAQQRSQSLIPEYDEVLWNTPITMTGPSASRASASQTSFSQMGENLVHIAEDSERTESEPHYHLRKRIRSSENINETFNESEIEMQVPEDTDDIDPEDTDDIDPEDLQGASLDDALDTIEGKNVPKRIAEWPNVAYRDFLELIVEGNISNKMGDKIINFFNKHSNLEKSPLPSSTKKGKDYLNQINSPLVDFKEKIVESYNEVDFTLYYRPIFRAIQALLQRPEVANNFVYKGSLKIINDGKDEIRVFGEPYEGNWWLETEASLPPLNRLLSIILYSDATTFDGLGKTSGHPVFLTFGNLPNLVRNLPEAKILLGFLPKVQDTGIKSTENFRNLQREVYHKCFKIMLQPLLEKPDALFFAINGRQMTFAARISFFLADMLEADDVTATYKGARCKMPCHSCMVLQSDLNNMNLGLEDYMPRTHENMQQAIIDGQGKEYSVHSVKNAFWKFP